MSKQTIVEYATRLGDDALILGHRLSEWCSNGPFLEEDIATINTSLDYIGRARMFLSYAAELEGAGRTEDDLAYTRDCRDFKNLLINELPRGDFAFTTVRQFLVDAFNLFFFEALVGSTDTQLAAIAAKSVKESRYHLRRSRDWMLRLGDGTEESHRRTQTALDDLWGYTDELFHMDPLESELLDTGVAVDRAAVRLRWEPLVTELIDAATLQLPQPYTLPGGGRQGVHTEHLGHLLAELQFVQRAYPGLQW
ncbi:phenylacetate-CoA oxygenase subunit PaaC [Exilibacterium tricleocarpae]|uniref:Phenylacetate-CoA oxygenase subunit PaaC n=1 Tax=Exilibacterium tricleocarpae TaxID=2591008 RepID=A0A545SP19_9GAMM|nr:1,2-phenylacetyl-CoA epoxidase subunit PaaC [Exilibacterium tricleocarpae]TQV66725.1 phenylacetate-CoA oxygenase subunit PaaC [Exilibacterium tricleocarpae]